MEVADEIVVMNEGRVVQVGAPRELYEEPSTEFVMSFVGAVTRVGDAYVRPHDLELTTVPNGSTEEVQVRRIVHLGFEVRVEFERADGDELVAQLSRAEAEELELAPGDIVWVRPTKERIFR
jgi:sulfate transport system ATP-binding protein